MNRSPRGPLEPCVPQRPRHGRLIRRAAVAIALVSLTATACSNSSATADKDAPTTNSTQLPKSVRDSGVLKYGVDISFPPMEYFENNEPVGFDIDLGNAIAKKFGVKAEFVSTSYSGIIPALQSRRFDVLLSSMTDTKEREQTINFLDYLDVGSTLLVQKGNPKGFTSMADVCGNTMAGQTGANASRIAHEEAARCQKEGKPKLTVQDYPDQSAVIMAIKSGRADAAALDYTGAVGFVRQDGGKTLEVAFEQQENKAPYGIGFRKDDESLMQSFQEALKALISDGTYAELLKKWDISAASLTTAAINGAVS